MMHADLRRLVASLAVVSFGCGGPGQPDVTTGVDVPRAPADVPAMDAPRPTEAGAPDTGVDAPADVPRPPVDVPTTPGTGCAGHAYLFCEDFESAAVGALPAGWTIDRGWQPGDPAVVTDQHHTGTHALHSAVTSMGQNRARYTFNPALGAARGQHWGRVFYRAQTPAFVPTSGVVHNTLLALLGVGELRVVDTVVNMAGAHQFLLNTPDDSCCIGSRYNYHSFDGAWHCAEWHIDQATQSYQFFFDGTEVTDIAFPHAAGETRRPIEVFTGISVGWRQYQNAMPPSESWFDDVAIDATRIGCL